MHFVYLLQAGERTAFCLPTAGRRAHRLVHPCIMYHLFVKPKTFEDHRALSSNCKKKPFLIEPNCERERERRRWEIPSFGKCTFNGAIHQWLVGHLAAAAVGPKTAPHSLHACMWVQGLARRWTPGCANAAGKANSSNKIHQTWGPPFCRAP